MRRHGTLRVNNIQYKHIAMSYRFLIAELTDQSFNPTALPPDVTGFRVRKAARGILIDGDKIALIHITKKNYHKLPGG